MGPGASRSRVDSRSAATELSGACGPAVLHPAEASRPDAAQRLGIVARGSGHRLSRQWRDARRKPDRSAPHLRHRPADRGFASHHHAYRREQRRRSRGGRPPYALPVASLRNHCGAEAGDRPLQHGPFDFALFAEGGVYQKPLGWNLLLDDYAQAGVVGIRERDFFADGGLAVSQPVWGRFSAGAATSPASTASMRARAFRCA